MSQSRDDGATNDGAADGARRRERLVLLVLAAVQFTSIVDFMVIMPLGPQLMRTLSINPARFGMLVSSYTFAACVAGLLASPVVDRFGRKAAFLTLYSGFLVGTLFCGLADGYSALLAARIVTGAFGGILGGMALTIIGDLVPEERRGAAIGSLTSAFALASVLGVPFGIYLGNRFDWHAPFLMLVALGSLVLLVALRVLPTLRDHVRGAHFRAHPLDELRATLTDPGHLRAFALVASLMLGGFLVIPYLAAYLVANVGISESTLTWLYVGGGTLTLVAAPIIGKLADRFGKLRLYRLVAPFAALMMLVATNLPRVSQAVAIGVAALLMAANAGRMVVAMAMVTGSVEPRRRGSFMSVNSSVQHFSTGLGAFLGGQIVVKAADQSLLYFDRVGYLAVAATAVSLVLAGRLRTAGPVPASTTATSLEAAAEALADADELLWADESA
ncbi:MAG: MFS transporter [Isosphaeraceae bacterium]|nr:MFS transporter [Isosphaeraceae bacterium]